MAVSQPLPRTWCLSAIDDPDSKAAICERILRSLPQWFGLEESLLEYAAEVRELPFFVVYSGNHMAVGFVALKPQTPFAAEVCVMGVLEEFHRQGVGKLLIAQCCEESRASGRVFLTVKTLAESRDNASYAKTRLFYSSMGFYPLEVFPSLWDECNPCLLMAKYLGAATD